MGIRLRYLVACCALLACGMLPGQAIQWHTETVDSTQNTGRYSSLAVDSLDRPHISYSRGYPTGLKCAHRNGAGWTAEVVDDGDSRGSRSSLAIDREDAVHILYTDNHNGRTLYTYQNGASWTRTDMGQLALTELAFAPDATEYPRAVGVVYNITRASYELKYAYWTGYAWSIENVDSINVDECASMVIDGSGDPHIAYFSYARASLRCAYRSNGVWTRQTVPLGSGSHYLGIYLSLAVDSAGNPHIAYTDNRDLRYASWNGSSWDIETIDQTTITDTYPCLAFDVADTPCVSYYKMGLGFAHKIGGSWVKETPDAASDVGRYTSLALDRSGGVHISYEDYTPNSQLKYAFGTLPGIAGRLTLGDYSGAVSDVPAVVELRKQGGGVETRAVSLDSLGSYSVPRVDPGTYDVAFKASHGLQVVLPGLLVGPDGLADVTVTLPNGDANGDNAIGFSDFNILRAAWDTDPSVPEWNPCADLDGSGGVGFADFNILRKNWG